MLVPAASARGQAPAPDAPAVQQYVDPLPTPEGGRVPGVAGGPPQRQGKLPPAVKRSLRRFGEEGAALDRLATDPAFGGPATRARDDTPPSERRRMAGRDDPDGVAGSVATESLGSNTLGLPLALILAGILAGGVTVFLLRRRRERVS